MAVSGLRARVERLLNGDIRGDDLSRLLLFVRDHCDGRRTVREIGDFIAHHTDRNKGLVTEEARDWFLTTSFVVPRVFGRGLDPTSLPTNISKILTASHRRLSPKILRDQTGLRYADAYKMLSSISKKLIDNGDGTLSLSANHTASEMRLFHALCSHIVARPAFDGDKLYSEFEASLQSNSLLGKEERARFATTKPALILLAVAEMHNCILELEDGTTCQLGLNISDGAISVNVPVPCKLGDGRTVFMAQSIFASGLTAADHCAPALLALPQPWKMDLEIVLPDVLLGPLG